MERRTLKPRRRIVRAQDAPPSGDLPSTSLLGHSHGLRTALTPLFRGVADAYRDAVAERSIAFASPAIAAVAALVCAYGASFLVYAIANRDLPSDAIAILVGVVLGVLGFLGGIGLARSRRAGHAVNALPSLDRDRYLIMLGSALVVAGMGALALYLVRIGSLPILMSGVEQGRVEAALRGGAQLRVLALLALPGCWLVVAVAAARRSRRFLAAAVGCALLVAAGNLLTANRANAFLVAEVAIVIGLLAAGLHRLRIVHLIGLVGAAVLLVLAAGFVGGYRYANSPETWGDPAIRSAAQAHDYVRLTALGVRAYLIVPLQNTQLTMDAVPSRIGWRLGITYLQPLLTALPGHQTTFDLDVKAALGQTYAGGGTVPSFLGEAYANFGPPGWLVVPFVLGFLLTLAYGAATTRQDPAWWALYGWAIIATVNANFSGLSVASPGPAIALVVLCFAAVVLPQSPGRRGVIVRPARTSVSR